MTLGKLRGIFSLALAWVMEKGGGSIAGSIPGEAGFMPVGVVMAGGFQHGFRPAPE
ncbi:hypothetical protein SAMN02745223_03444 [Devosia limi DSM 17137]|uniref:Uncharacterized protein n=1 Tax=Devosia limi DSM 17137 TaxID=1121477 RepID=A0A1M5E3G3_9HYPH|nr:hypothetical protein SAMN02745223_03444 [Devosia limi DSM 17137]